MKPYNPETDLPILLAEIFWFLLGLLIGFVLWGIK